MKKIATLSLMILLTAAMARGQVVGSSIISIPSSGLPSVITILPYCSHGYDETISLVPDGAGGMMVFFSVSDESVRIRNGRLQSKDGVIQTECGPVSGHPNIFWIQIPPFRDERAIYSIIATQFDQNGYVGETAIELNIYPEGMTEDNSTAPGSFGSGHEFDYIYSLPIFGPDVIRQSFNKKLYFAGEYIPEKLRGREKRTDRTPYEYANLRRCKEEFPRAEYEREKQCRSYHENKD